MSKRRYKLPSLKVNIKSYILLFFNDILIDKLASGKFFRFALMQNASWEAGDAGIMEYSSNRRQNGIQI